MKTKLGRLSMLDALRGFTVLSMVAYHLMYDLNIVYGGNVGWAAVPRVHLWQQCICWGFIIISGFTWSMGRNKNLRRGLMLNLWGLVITAVTYIVMPEQTIYFGILSFLGCAVLLLVLLDKPLQRLNPLLGLVLCFGLFLLMRWSRAELLDEICGNVLLVPFGLPHEGFYSADYFPLFPWFMLYLCGYFLNGVFQRHSDWMSALELDALPTLSYIGRRSLPVYLLHQPLLMLVLTVVNSGAIMETI